MSDVLAPPQLRRTVAAVAATWPTLLAWFLGGWLVRSLLVHLAGHLGAQEALWGLLVLPLAVLARLVSYVAIFLVVRDAVAPAVDATPAPRRRLGRLSESVTDAIVPFFLIYAAWAIVDEDVLAYGRSAADQLDFDTIGPGEGPLTVSIGVLSVSLVAVAFALRLVLRWAEGWAPRWTAPLSVYLEALWVLVAVLVLRSALAGVPAWLAERRLIAWTLDQVARVEPLRAALGPAWSLLTDVVLLPLAWLALAAVVFAHVVTHELPDDPRAVARLRARVGAMPSRWQRTVGWASEGFLERWEPVRRVAGLAWRAGPLPVAAYVAAFAVVTALGPWLALALPRLLGPHEASWWSGTAATLDLVVDAVVVPLQLALVAGALAHLTRLAALRRARAAGPRAAVAGR
jgi:hypothetical protein